jgi:hypothetical protein
MLGRLEDCWFRWYCRELWLRPRDKCRTQLRARKFDLVCVWRFDRFARSTQHLGHVSQKPGLVLERGQT